MVKGMVKGRAPDDFGRRVKASEQRVLTSWWAWAGVGGQDIGDGAEASPERSWAGGARSIKLFVSRELDVPLGEFVFEICGRISIQGH